MRQNPQKLLELYDETYYRSLKSRAEEEQTLINNALRMLLCLQVPLRTADFIFALCSCEDASLAPEDLVDLCSSFVTIDTELNIFRFAHLSVREFLETKDDYEPDRNHALVAELCLRYLSSSVIIQATKYWKNQHAGSGMDPPNANSKSQVLVHRHPTEAPSARHRTNFTLRCDSCQQKMPSLWYCSYPAGTFDLNFCEDCVDKGRTCKHEDRCPLVKSLVSENPNILITEDVLNDEKEHVDAEAPISTLSMIPTFLNGFHQYSCLYWPFHLSESMNLRYSPRLQAISLNFMIGGQQTASASYVSWSNTFSSFPRSLSAESTWGYDMVSDQRVLHGISQPADCIFMAAIWGFCDILELRAGIDPETVNVSQLAGFPALHLAIIYGGLEAAQTLLEKGAKLEERNFDGYTALGTAVVVQKPEIVRLLLERGADVRTKQGDGCILQQAVKDGQLAIIRLLLNYGATPEEGGMIDDPALSLAATKGNEEAIKLLLDSLTSTDSSTKSLWKMMTRIQRLMRTEGEAGLLQSLGTWPESTIANRFLGTVLWRAVERQDEACARLLLARGADPNTVCENKTAFRVALRPLFKGKIEQLKFLKMLLAHGATPDIRRIGKSGIEMLMAWGIDFDMIDLVRLCADSGADLNRACSNLYGDPLFCAVKNRNVEIVRFLLQRGADPQEVSAQFFSGIIKPRDSGEHSLEDSEEIGELLSAHKSTLRSQPG